MGRAEIVEVESFSVVLSAIKIYFFTLFYDTKQTPTPNHSHSKATHDSIRES